MRLLVMIAFALAQWLLSAKQRKLRWIPVFMLFIGFAVCAWIYFAGTGSGSASVIAENRYFALFLAEYFTVGLAGCVAGHLIATISKR